MLWCIATADQREVDSGDLNKFLDSAVEHEVKVIAVLREVSEDDAARFAGMPQVSEVVSVERCGVSRARNAGLQALRVSVATFDDYVAFPDDDCKYGKQFGGNLKRLSLEHDGPDVIFGSYGEGPAAEYPARPAKASDALLRVSSVGIFVKWGLLQSVGNFNTALGVGSKGFAYGEDNDMAYRILTKSRSAVFAPELRVWHLESRMTSGRNPKGYLSVCALHLPNLTPVALIARGVFSAVVQDIVRLDVSLSQVRAVGRALNPRALMRAKLWL